ncbi:hypothetical protein QQF64_005542 [Cirrhinus molitorella]|uniref:Uncharacterized protein n=1 Tax=Cirrhinus molitorella TaxID=172907 RepID=A0ABR3MGJ1_9TELE
MRCFFPSARSDFHSLGRTETEVVLIIPQGLVERGSHMPRFTQRSSLSVCVYSKCSQTSNRLQLLPPASTAIMTSRCLQRGRVIRCSGSQRPKVKATGGRPASVHQDCEKTFQQADED